MGTNRVWRILQITLAFFMLYGGIQCFLEEQLVSSLVPLILIINRHLIGLLGIILGVALVIPKFSKLGALGILLLVLLSLLINAWSIFSAPLVSQQAWMGLVFHALFLVWAYKVSVYIRTNR